MTIVARECHFAWRLVGSASQRCLPGVSSGLSTRACPDLQIPSRVGSSILITARVLLDSWRSWRVVYGFCYCHDLMPPPCSAPVASPLTLLSLSSGSQELTMASSFFSPLVIWSEWFLVASWFDCNFLALESLRVLFLSGDSDCLLGCWRRFQALRDVVYKPGFGVIARLRVVFYKTQDQSRRHRSSTNKAAGSLNINIEVSSERSSGKVFRSIHDVHQTNKIMFESFTGDAVAKNFHGGARRIVHRRHNGGKIHRRCRELHRKRFGDTEAESLIGDALKVMRLRFSAPPELEFYHCTAGV
ncbi:hypothetical protein Bca52824_024346 [Brassica carinata]|uniref:Uncharacterized protein n=1 Tax=Brassica carinata TaxID=52824 RepID=A0A8X8ATM1_BRACI|nr:hypothetical protein Bca52824_024346 [Brassica carinata]